MGWVTLDLDQGPTSVSATNSFARVQMIQVVLAQSHRLKLPRRAVEVDEARAERGEQSFFRPANLRNEQFRCGHRVIG